MNIGMNISKKIGYDNAIKQAYNLGATAFMFYNTPPQGFNYITIGEETATKVKKVLKEINISTENLIIHGPYVTNLANPEQDKIVRSAQRLIDEIDMCQLLEAKYLVLHPGNYIAGSVEDGLDRLAKNLDVLLTYTSDTDVTICLETMARKGTTVGYTFEQLAYVISQLNRRNKSRIGICLDTCHIYDAGYSLEDTNKLLDEFDRVIGLNYLKVIHVNGSKNELGSNKDRHANILSDDNHIEPKHIHNLVNNERLKDVKFILETPQNEFDFDRQIQEISYLKSNSVC